MSQTHAPLPLPETSEEIVLPPAQRAQPAANTASFSVLPPPDSSEPPELVRVASRGYN